MLHTVTETHWKFIKRLRVIANQDKRKQNGILLREFV